MENDDPEYHASHPQFLPTTSISDTLNGNALFYEPEEPHGLGNTDTTLPNVGTADQERPTLESFEQRAQAMLKKLYPTNLSPEEENKEEALWFMALMGLFVHFSNKESA